MFKPNFITKAGLLCRGVDYLARADPFQSAAATKYSDPEQAVRLVLELTE